MGKLRGVLIVLGGGIATVMIAVAWVSLRWLDRGPSPQQAAPTSVWGTIASMAPGALIADEPQRRSALVGSSAP